MSLERIVMKFGKDWSWMGEKELKVCVRVCVFKWIELMGVEDREKYNERMVVILWCFWSWSRNEIG